MGNLHKKKRKWFSGKVKWTVYLFIFSIILGLIGYAAILYGGRLVVDEQDLILDATTIVETRDGEVIGKLYNENRSLVGIEEVPEHVINAFLAIEDRRFYEHAGIDFRSVARAVYRDIIAMSKVEGASTITQQLSKNLFLHNDKTWMRKTKEAMASVYLERKLSKDNILELYVNQIYYGHGIYGVETASQHFFSKPVSDLTVAEGALLAGLAKAPNGYSPVNQPEKALTRRNVVLRSMENAGMITAEKRLQEEGKTLGLSITEREARPWMDSYIDLVMKEAAEKHQLSINELKRGGYRIVVNIDKDVQQIAYEQFENGDYFPGNTDGVEGAFVMMEQETGRIVSAIGGRDYQLGDLNRVTVTRQPGSTIKPIAVYGPAMMLQDGKYHPYSIIPDQQKDFDGYTVANADNQYEGAVSIYDALIYSKNAPTVWLLDQIGVKYAKDYLSELTISIEDNGLAIALGGLTEGITPVDMMESYGAFSRDGEVVESSTIDRLYNRDKEMIFQGNPSTNEVFSPQVAWNMTEILLETVRHGTATAGDYSKALAGKTGSTQHPIIEGQTKDAWFVGYTPEYVSALWMGYDKTDKDHFLTGGSEFPTRLTKAILTEMDKKTPLAEHFSKPANVTALPKPIRLPQITNLEADFSLGGFSIVRGKLTWEGSEDERIIYRIYQDKEGIDERVGEVEGTNEFFITANFFRATSYYVVPYDPLTKMEGKRSESVELSW
ncbi:transglycosylase domain-containing protein [Virgibacillus sp. C22-A2]|uniref:Transglycosylase domain-containing protein n=1 Tax=Virgibacillus tibetensis TaxID=3042313 RepID=A0ABU6KGV2_9BACI|nr:transglycosylase domain-containing protein [Virgibacillus sp. C22-A2]